MKTLLLFLFIGFPVQYPKETYSMDAQQFQEWAIDYNVTAVLSLKSSKVSKYYGIFDVQTNGFNSSINGPGSWYKNPNYIGPGPLTIINPYVRPMRNGKFRSN